MRAKQQIDGISLAQEIWQALTVAIGETAEIEVTTYVESGDLGLTEKSALGSGFRTRIDLFEQTVAHEIDRKLIDNPAYRELQRWHIEQVRQRQESLPKNLASLEAMRHLILNPDSD
ncbi:MAG: hypothetical protein AAFO95_10620 [Cyanobacteria bacterium J06600_6]